MTGPRDGGHLIEMVLFSYSFCIMAVTVDLIGVLTTCIHVGFGRGGFL